MVNIKYFRTGMVTGYQIFNDILRLEMFFTIINLDLDQGKK